MMLICKRLRLQALKEQGVQKKNQQSEIQTEYTSRAATGSKVYLLLQELKNNT